MLKNQYITIACLALVVLAGVGWTNFLKPHPINWQPPKNWPKPVYDFKKNRLTEEGFTLGRQLFYDGNLSQDGNFSCASCHQQFAAFATYDHNVSHGINNHFTTRNATALQNLAWQTAFMQDGGINHLDVQFLAPLTAEIEMGETIANVINKLKKDTLYTRLFTSAFGDATINTQRIGKALSQFMLQLVSCNSKYDKVMRGQAQFILPEALGYQIFKQKCNSCHTEPLFTDFSYRNIGMPLDDYLQDIGRMKITGNRADSLKFRVPSLRNVAVTAPYGHDGRFFSLYNLFEQYRTNAINGPTTDSVFKHKMPLSNFEIGQITAFLHTLTDSSFLTNTRFADPNNHHQPPIFKHLH